MMQNNLEKEKKKVLELDITAESCKKKASEDTLWTSSNYLYPATKCSRTESLSEEHKHMHLSLAFQLAVFIISYVVVCSDGSTLH